MNKTLSRGLMACLSLVALASCQDYDGGFSLDTIKKAEYAKHFEDTFGKIDPNQDWSMATLVKANVNLPGLTGTAKMNICTGDPRNSETRLLAQIMLKDGKGSIDFDAIKGSDNVFVTVEQDGEYKVFSKRTIVNGMLNIGVVEQNYSTPMTRAFSSTCPVTKDGPEVTLGYTYTELTTLPDDGEDAPLVMHVDYKGDERTLDAWIAAVEANTSYGYNDDNWSPFEKWEICTVKDGSKNAANAWQGWTFDWTNIENKFKSEGVTTSMKPAGGSSTPDAPTHNIKLQYLSGVETDAAEPWYRAEGYSLYGYDGFFEEQAHYFEAHTTILGHEADKPSLYGETLDEQIEFMRKLEGGFEITSTGGPIEIPFIYGATDKSNQFGYVFYESGDDPLAQTHYVLMNDGRPAANVFQDSWKGDQIDYDKTLPGFENTSIVNFILDQIDARWETELNRPMKGTNGWCYCNEGTGIWSAAGEHLAECPAKDNETAECICEQARDGKYFTENRVHGDACKDPAIEYKNMLNTPVYGTKYRLVYWDASANDGEGAFTYNIPAGKKIVFFIMNQAANTKPQDEAGNHPKPNNYNYSLPSLNQRIGSTYQNTNSPTYDEMKDKGAVKSAAWTAGGVTYLGFEDGGNDEDLNDIVFMVSGNYSTTKDIPVLHTVRWHLNVNGIHEDNDIVKVENLKQGANFSQPDRNPVNGDSKFLGWATSPKGSVVIPASQSDYTGVMGSIDINYYAIWENTPVVPDPEYISWMFACEDLGGSFDYDFNDVVWEIRHDKTNAKVEVRIVAAGGTLPFTLQYKGDAVMTKEQAFGAGCNSTVMIHPTPTDWQTVATAVPEDWSITTHSGDFSILVLQKAGDNGTSSTVISIYSKDDEDASKNTKTPQVLVLPEGWQWPDEGQGIGAKYPSFKAWVSDSGAAFDWKTVVNNGNQEIVEGN